MYKSVWRELKKTYAKSQRSEAKKVDMRVTIIPTSENIQIRDGSFCDANILFWVKFKISNIDRPELATDSDAILDTGNSSTLTLPMSFMEPLGLLIEDKQLESESVAATGQVKPIYGFTLRLQIGKSEMCCPVFFSEIDTPLLGNGFLSQCHFFQIQGRSCFLSIKSPVAPIMKL